MLKGSTNLPSGRNSSICTHNNCTLQNEAPANLKSTTMKNITRLPSTAPHRRTPGGYASRILVPADVNGQTLLRESLANPIFLGPTIWQDMKTPFIIPISKEAYTASANESFFTK